MSGMLLIASAAYSGSELEAEFGRLPPAFLPIGNRRLFVHQHAALAKGFDRVVLSLPDDFTPDAMDAEALAARGIEVIHVPASLSLGQSVVYVLNVTAMAAGPVAILHGDTLLEGVDAEARDAVSVGEVEDDYAWGHVTRSGGAVTAILPKPPAGTARPEVLSGWFRLSSGALLVQHITRQGGDFLAGLAAYAQERPLRALHATQWLDFGHLNTFHRSRRRMTTERGFNRLNASRRRVEKTGTPHAKIVAEARWFDSLPPALRIHTPAYLGMREEAGVPSYAIEYLHLPTLSDLFVFGRLARGGWGRIFDACDEFLTGCAAHPAGQGEAGDTDTLYLDKTMARLERHARETGLSLDAPCRLGGVALPSLTQMAQAAAAAIPPAQARHLTLVHGDFCFSNILYDARAELARVIDPRGLDSDGRLTSFGDLRYDLAKLFHSVVGRYDHIIAGAARVRRDGPLDVTLELPGDRSLAVIEAEFLERRYAGMHMMEASAPAIAVLLFLSMLPLHADVPARQDAFLANAMRLFLRMDRRQESRA